MIIVGFVFLIFTGFTLAVILAAVIVSNRGKAKKEAREILKGKTVSQDKKASVCKVLATIPNDLEAADLWSKLQEK